MAHFAEIDDDNTVVRVLVVGDEFEDRGEDYLANELGLGGRWIKTSFNNRIRGKFAGMGDLYLEDLDKFIDPKPYPSWILDRDEWVAPNAMPTDGKDYEWNEDEYAWIEVSN